MSTRPGLTPSKLHPGEGRSGVRNLAHAFARRKSRVRKEETDSFVIYAEEITLGVFVAPGPESAVWGASLPFRLVSEAVRSGNVTRGARVGEIGLVGQSQH